VLSPDYNIYADIQQEINIKLFEKFEDEQIVFAFPSRTIYFSDEQKGGQKAFH
jgi:small-conductance mechanosensitive channel